MLGAGLGAGETGAGRGSCSGGAWSPVTLTSSRMVNTELPLTGREGATRAGAGGREGGRGPGDFQAKTVGRAQLKRSLGAGVKGGAGAREARLSAGERDALWVLGTSLPGEPPPAPKG